MLTRSWRSSASMPMDAYRHENHLVINFDLPGVEADAVELTVEKNVLKVTAQRPRPQTGDIQWLAAERPHGTYRCELWLGEGVDLDALKAGYDQGVLTLTVPVIEPAKRRIEITSGNSNQSIETPQAA